MLLASKLTLRRHGAQQLYKALIGFGFLTSEYTLQHNDHDYSVLARDSCNVANCF